VAANLAAKRAPLRTIAARNVAARGARLAGVGGVNVEHRHTVTTRLVRNEGPELEETPVMQSCPLSALGRYPRTNAREILKGNRSLGAFRLLHELLGDAVVGILLKSSLLAGNRVELPTGCSRPLALKVPAAMSVTTAASLNVIAREWLSIRIDRQVHDAKIDTKNVSGLDRNGFGNITSRSDEEIATLHLKIDFALPVDKELSLVLAANKRNLDTTINRPDGDGVVVAHPEDASVEGLGGQWAEAVVSLLIPLVAGCNLGNALDDDLGREPARLARAPVSGSMDVEAFENAVLPGVSADLVAGGVSHPQRLQQRRLLLRGRLELDGSDQLHVSYVTADRDRLQVEARIPPHP